MLFRNAFSLHRLTWPPDAGRRRLRLAPINMGLLAEGECRNSSHPLRWWDPGECFRVTTLFSSLLGSHYDPCQDSRSSW